MYIYILCIINIIYSCRSAQQLLNICILKCTHNRIYMRIHGSQGPDEKRKKYIYNKLETFAGHS